MYLEESSTPPTAPQQIVLASLSSRLPLEFVGHATRRSCFRCDDRFRQLVISLVRYTTFWQRYMPCDLVSILPSFCNPFDEPIYIAYDKTTTCLNQHLKNLTATFLLLLLRFLHSLPLLPAWRWLTLLRSQW